MSSSKSISIFMAEDLGRRLPDPKNQRIFHFEAYLPFTEAVKLERGNANVRPPKDNKPYKNMIKSAQETPELFHLMNRGITYLCESFKYDNQEKRLAITIPNIPKSRWEEDDVTRFGIADGGHTFKAIEEIVDTIDELRNDDDWAEPHVRVHFVATDLSDDIGINEVVEALNTSTQVKSFTLDEYNNRFDELKKALSVAKFDIAHVAFTENQDKAWHVTEIIQRLGCFLKERWKTTPPSQMYRSKDKALQLFVSETSDPDFKRLFPVIKDVVTLPEYIEANLPSLLEGSGRRVGKVKGVKKLKKQARRECTDYVTDYSIDAAILLPMAAAFRSLLFLRNDAYQWRVDPYKVFRHCAADLYDVLLQRIRRVKNVSQLAADQEYWLSCAQVVANAKDEVELAA